jgi:putative endonuclease
MNNKPLIIPTNKDFLRKLREDVKKKWGSLSFLDGLKGHVKEDIAQFYECEASHLLTDESEMTKEQVDKIIRNDHGWIVYIVECSDGTLYTGISNDLSKRLLTHNRGKGAKYTRGRLPVALIWFKKCTDKSEASKLEYKIKKMSRKAKLKMIKDGK